MLYYVEQSMDVCLVTNINADLILDNLITKVVITKVGATLQPFL